VTAVVVHRISCTAIEPRHGRGDTARHGAAVQQLANGSGGAHRRHLTGNGWCMGELEAELRLRLAEHIGQLSPESHAKAEEFSKGSPGGSVDRAGNGDEPSEARGGGASSQGQRRARDEGKAKARDSWCAGWLKRGEARRREKKEKEERAKELEHRRRAIAEVAEAKRKEKERLEQEALFRQQCGEEGCPQKEMVLEEVIQRVQEDEKVSPDLRAAVIEAGRFLADWGEVREEFEERGIPIDRAWLAHVVNNPEAARSLDPELRVEPDRRLPDVVHKCLVPCRICDQHHALRDRWAAWDMTQEALRRAAEIQHRQRAEAETRTKAQAQARRRRIIEEKVAAAKAAQRAEEEAQRREEQRTKAQKEARARAREESRPRIEAHAAVDSEAQREKERKRGGGRPFLVEVTIEETEEQEVYRLKKTTPSEINCPALQPPLTQLQHVSPMAAALQEELYVVSISKLAAPIHR
jgi:hypothetical protein